MDTPTASLAAPVCGTCARFSVGGDLPAGYGRCSHLAAWRYRAASAGCIYLPGRHEPAGGEASRA